MKKIICENCDKIIRSKTALTNHKESTHLEIKGIEITEPELSKVKWSNLRILYGLSQGQTHNCYRQFSKLFGDVWGYCFQWRSQKRLWFGYWRDVLCSDVQEERRMTTKNGYCGFGMGPSKCDFEWYLLVYCQCFILI